MGIKEAQQHIYPGLARERQKRFVDRLANRLKRVSHDARCHPRALAWGTGSMISGNPVCLSLAVAGHRHPSSGCRSKRSRGGRKGRRDR
jgi:hypothetical protein